MECNGKEKIKGNDVLTFSSALASDFTMLERKKIEIWENFSDSQALYPLRSTKA